MYLSQARSNISIFLNSKKRLVKKTRRVSFFQFKFEIMYSINKTIYAKINKKAAELN